MPDGRARSTRRCRARAVTQGSHILPQRLSHLNEPEGNARVLLSPDDRGAPTNACNTAAFLVRPDVKGTPIAAMQPGTRPRLK